MLTGGCFCGAIRYEVEGTPFHATNCHCSIDFRIVEGEPMRFNSTERGARSFCSRCGTQLTFRYAELGDEIDVTTCSLDHPELVPPKDNTRTSSRLVWIAPDGLPDHREARHSG
jgi:hypothetical protein